MNDAVGLLEPARSGEPRAIARLLTIVENDEPGSAEVMRLLYPHTGQARVVGITGPPGSGKSTLVSRLAAAYRERDGRVAVVAIDPSSPFSGGAILGDRIRMRDRFLDQGVFIRSMASRGHSGGVGRATRRVVQVLDALGVATVLVETVGVGQDEIEVVRVADTVCLVTVPGLGDDIQAIKAGIVEIADVLVVNKSDRPGADDAVRDLAMMQSLATTGGSGRPRGLTRPGPEWRAPIVRTSATEGSGTEELVAAVAKHGQWARDSGEHERRRREAAAAEVEALLREALLRRARERIGAERVEEVVGRVAAREIDPYAAVERLLATS